ncbi:hypothetical protein I6L80_15630 [Providencia rettgeri]|uniref:Uncharacterized protein n=1 Tax=Providencia rettgeri TaxID=587 RepID=A0A379FTL0_PRORE|nr:hypothetical protein I6L80_15630 [Providencia rettgeri]SUC32099.1 Uncharacterised protein [Providencia rettgeri]
MRHHNFASIMLTVCRVFELNTKDITGNALNMRDKYATSDFSLHQKFFDIYYNKIIDIIDAEAVYSQEDRRDVFYKYEQLYNEVVHTMVYSNLEKDIITKKYMETAIPAIIALDMYQTLSRHTQNEQPPSFYHHIQAFLLSDDYLLDNSDPKHLFQGVRHYLKKMLKQQNIQPKESLMEINSLIDNIRSGKNPKTSSIKHAIKICKFEAKNFENELDEFEKTYTSLSTLLRLQNTTGWVPLITQHYRELMEENMRSSHLLSSLHMYLYRFNYDKGLLKECAETLIHYANVITLKKDRIEQYTLAINYLKSMIFKGDFPSANHTENEFKNLKRWFEKRADIPLLAPYAKLTVIIDLLYNKKLEEAYQLTHEMLSEELPYGYLKATFANISLALKIKLQKNTIKNGTLLRLINPILNSQGEYVDFALGSATSLNNPIITDPNNLTILRAIKTYNTLITTITPAEDNEEIERYPQTISGLLNEVNIALEKLDDQLSYIDEICSEHFADVIIEKKVLTRRELTQNLIGILNHCTLNNCIGCLPVLMKYLKAPDEEQEAIASFMGISEDSELERNVLVETLHIVHEKLDQQTNTQ